jgi:hypothetical protein
MLLLGCRRNTNSEWGVRDFAREVRKRCRAWNEADRRCVGVKICGAC